jgi:hypothetical protein
LGVTKNNPQKKVFQKNINQSGDNKKEQATDARQRK